MCKVKTCDGENTHNVAFRVSVINNTTGAPEILVSLSGPFCASCADKIKTEYSDDFPPNVFAHITKPMIEKGYTPAHSKVDIVVMELAQKIGGKYYPQEGNCAHPECRAEAVGRVVIKVPSMRKDLVTYMMGECFCGVHLPLMLDPSRVDIGDLRAALFRLQRDGMDPNIDGIRVEARLIDWQPEMEPGTIILGVTNIEAEREKLRAAEIQQRRKNANNARNN